MAKVHRVYRHSWYVNRFQQKGMFGLGSKPWLVERQAESAKLKPDQQIRWLRETLVKMEEAKITTTPSIIQEEEEEAWARYQSGETNGDEWRELYAARKAMIRRGRPQESIGVPHDLFERKTRRKH